MSTTAGAAPPIRIGLVGTVGVPARYGGFETLAEQLAAGTDPARAAWVVYCQRTAYPEEARATPFQGHRRVFVPLRANGASSIVHDVLAMLHAALVARVDVLLVLGNSGAWGLPIVRLLRPGLGVVTNIDGMEWRRAKFGAVARKTLRILEWFAVRFSHRIIADNAALVPISRGIHGIEPVLIAYGGDHTLVPAARLDIAPGYFLSIARIEPENNCHLILEAFANSGQRLVFVGNWAASAYGRELQGRFGQLPHITMRAPVYGQTDLAALRAGAQAYVHGHSVGGTNPSLVEALFHAHRVLAFDCSFNRTTLADAGAYFSTSLELQRLAADAQSGLIASGLLETLRDRYRWSRIIDAYLDVCRAVR